MTRLLAALAAVLLASPAGAQVVLSYQGPTGRVVDYRLSLQASGEQTSLGERRPIAVQAEFELREEVVATGPAGSFLLHVQARALAVKDPTGTFATGERSRFPEVELLVTHRGEVLSSRIGTAGETGPFERAFASLMMAPGLVVLPTGPAVVGEEWTWEEAGAFQRSRLLSVVDGAAGRVAKIATSARSPLRLEERSEALGVTAHLAGEETGASELELLLDTGTTLRHKGEAHLTTNGEISLQLSQGARRFPVSSKMRVRFDLRLVRVDGRPVARK